VISMRSQADALGQIAGGPIVGAVGNVSLRAALAVSSVLLTPALWLYARTLRGRQTEQGEQVAVSSEQ
jgi:DHA3 family tetracycline resistance protein-like MFS transporter